LNETRLIKPNIKPNCHRELPTIASSDGLRHSKNSTIHAFFSSLLGVSAHWHRTAAGGGS
jgi:hypothetical protein